MVTSRHIEGNSLKKSVRSSLLGLGILAWGGVLGCSSSSSPSSSGSGLSFPDVAKVVLSSTPAGLKSATSAGLRLDQVLLGLFRGFPVQTSFAANATVSDVTSSLTGMFKGTFAKVSGGQSTGYINSNLEDLDSRVAELEQRFTSNPPTCFNNTPSDLSVDFSNHVDAKLTLKVSCRDEFTWKSGDQGAPGSGMVFGKRAKSGSVPELVSLTLLLKHKTSTAEGGSDSYDAGFGYAGTVTGYGTADESVEMLFGQFNTKSGLSNSDEDQPLMARIYTKTATKAFEVVLASTSSSAGGPLSGGSSYLGCGFRMISDGTIIVAQGDYLGTGPCSGGSPNTVDVCVDATTLADVSSTSASACAALKATQYHVASSASSLNTFKSAVLTGNTVTASTNIFNSLKPGSTTVKAVTTAVTQ